MTRHWDDRDFTVVATRPSVDGSGKLDRFGYCEVCKADMQSFGEGPVRHYASHDYARRLGLWGARRKHEAI